MGTLTLKTAAQAALFVHELKGQISDGQWENSFPNEHYKAPCAAKVVVGDNVGRDFQSMKPTYRFASNELVDIVGGRMIVMARIAILFGVDKVELYKELFNDSVDHPIDGPAYAGEYYDNIRAQLAELDKTAIHRAVIGCDYGRKELMVDLWAIQCAYKTVRAAA